MLLLDICMKKKRLMFSLHEVASSVNDHKIQMCSDVQGPDIFIGAHQHIFYEFFPSFAHSLYFLTSFAHEGSSSISLLV